MDNEPDPRFLEHLDWQIRTALRRRERFARPASAPAWRALRTAALILVSLLGGAGAVVAAERMQDAQERERLLAKTRIELEMAELRLDHANDARERARAQSAAGRIDGGRLAEAEGRAQTLAAAAERLRLDLQETELSGAAPRRDLGAPFVAGRDFVAENLQLDLRAAEADEARRRTDLDRAQRLFEAGVLPSTDLARDRGALEEATEAVETVRARIELRGRFVGGAIDARAVALEERILAAETGIRRAETALRRAEERLEYARRLVEAQIASGKEVANGELEVELLARELELLQLERERLVAQRG